MATPEHMLDRAEEERSARATAEPAERPTNETDDDWPPTGCQSPEDCCAPDCDCFGDDDDC